MNTRARETELKERYQTEIVDCHPLNTPPPITFEEFKELDHRKGRKTE